MSCSSEEPGENDMELTSPDLINEAQNKIKYMSSSSEEPSENDMESTSPDIINESQNALSVVPSKSQHQYMRAYNNFISWKIRRKTKLVSENVLMAYFHELSTKYKPSSLWCIYSKLRTTLKSKDDIDIKKYMKLTALLRRYSVGFIKTKSKLLSLEHVERFLNEAPDDKYLLTKVILIFGMTGACRRQELADLKLSDIENHGDLLLFKIPDTKKQTPRTFVIQGQYREIVKKYEALRVPKAKSGRFFQNYQKGRCTCQVVGVNKIGNTAKVIARFLKLPDSEAYTGSSFRFLASESMIADPNKPERPRRLRSNSISEDNNDSSVKIKKEIEFESSFVSEFEEAGAASPHEAGRSPRQRSVTPFDNVTKYASVSEFEEAGAASPHEAGRSPRQRSATPFENVTKYASVNENHETCDISLNNHSQTLQLSKQQITLNFSNCTNITINLHN